MRSWDGDVMTQWNRRETMPRFVFREQQDRNKKRRGEKKKKKTDLYNGRREREVAGKKLKK